ncbi:MAG TPA: glycosyltransferase [Chitinophagaceae bacterium]|nr:glycosyltransferase [Chitinophagaceae bacterium]
MNRIPKIIHYCWFGGETIPSEYKDYVVGWKELHPDWIVREWNDQTFPVKHPYCDRARKEGNWANLSNFCRLWALIQEGGVYLDIDVKLIKPLDPFLVYRCFLGFEDGEAGGGNFWINNAVLGAEKSHPFVLQSLEHLVSQFDGTEEANLSSPALSTDLLIEKYGLKNYGTQELLDGINLFEKEVFYPISWKHAIRRYSYEQYISDNTVGIHMWGRTWYSRDKMIGVIDELQDWAFTLESEIERQHQLNSERGIAYTGYLELLKKLLQKDRNSYKERYKLRVRLLEEKLLEKQNELLHLAEKERELRWMNKELDKKLTMCQVSGQHRTEELELQLQHVADELSDLKNQYNQFARMTEGLQSTVRILVCENETKKKKIDTMMREHENSDLRTQSVLSEKDQIIEDLRNSIEWYKRTYENRRLLGIIKDRLKKTNLRREIK